MPYFQLNSKYEILGESDTNDFPTLGFMVVRAEDRSLLPHPIPPKAITIPTKSRLNEVKLTPKLKHSLRTLYESKSYEDLKDLADKKGVYKLCCGATMSQLVKDFKEAADNGVI